MTVPPARHGLRRRHLLALLATPTAAWLALPARAELTMEERLPLVVPRARRLRRALLAPGLDPYRIEADHADALQRAERLWERGQADQALQALAPLQKYAPIAELPFIKVQLLMAAIAQHQGRQDLLRHHRAFATALVRLIDASGDGRSEATALRLVLPSEADGWFLAHADRYTPIAKRIASQRRRSQDLWQVRRADGGEQTLYFDVSPMLRARGPRASAAPKPTSAARARAGDSNG